MALELVNRIIPRLAECRGAVEWYASGQRVRRPFRDIVAEVMQSAAVLRQFGLPPQARVGIMGANSYEWLVADLACVACGLVVVPLEARDESQLEPLAGLLDLRLVVGTQRPVRGLPTVPLTAPLAGTAAAADRIVPYTYSSADVWSVKFTSGSTHDAKALEAHAESVESSLRASQAMFHHGHGDRILVFLPFSLLQQRYWIYSAILFDYDVIVATPALAMYAAREARPTVIMGVPEFFETVKARFLATWSSRFGRLLLRAAAAASSILSRVGIRTAFPPFQRMLGGRIRYLWTGSAASSPDTVRFYFAAGMPLYQGYGMNETCIVSKNYPGHNRIGSAGKLLPHIEVRFDDDGQLYVRNRTPVSTRYLRCGPGDNENTFLPDGFVRTGDLGHLDADGYLYITGRKKELIVLSSGKKVEPQKVEMRLRACPAIGHCMVYGSERPYLVALVEPASEQVTEEELRRHVAEVNATLLSEERIARFLVVRSVFTAESGFLTSQFKLKRGRIVEAHRDAIEALYAC